MSSNSALASIIFLPFQIFLKHILFSNIVKFEIFKTVKVCGYYNVLFSSLKSTGVPYRVKSSNVTDLIVNN